MEKNSLKRHDLVASFIIIDINEMRGECEKVIFISELKFIFVSFFFFFNPHLPIGINDSVFFISVQHFVLWFKTPLIHWNNPNAYIKGSRNYFLPNMSEASLSKNPCFLFLTVLRMTFQS